MERAEKKICIFWVSRESHHIHEMGVMALNRKRGNLDQEQGGMVKYQGNNLKQNQTHPRIPQQEGLLPYPAVLMLQL